MRHIRYALIYSCYFLFCFFMWIFREITWVQFKDAITWEDEDENLF